MSIAKLANGRVFPAPADQSLLDAAQAAGVVLPYGCRTGRCSTCKARVISGRTQAMVDEVGLSPSDVLDGWILTCVRTALTDVELDADQLGDKAMPVPKTVPCRISQLASLAPGVLGVTLRLPPSSAFEFIPGQYIDVIGPNGMRRSYSLASANVAGGLIELHIRQVEGGGMSQYWFHDAKLNDLLRLNGPLGTFFLRETANMNLYFLATGTGMAPVKAMLESITDLPVDQRPRSVTVLWGARQSYDLYLDPVQLGGVGGAHTYVPVLSRTDQTWLGAQGHVQDVLLGLVSDWSNAAVYACGSEAMIRDAQKCLTEVGLPPKRFYSDAFVCSATI